ncbi:MAG: molybdopterin molybdotransferase MoeA, partial [Micromonosporaceae bacterium]|nr:molybdopterin molybdotransferase MoeA [Micromonosporaceae bacterium]
MTATISDGSSVDRRSTPMSWPDARTLAHRLADPLPAETVPLAHAGGRTLARPVLAAVDVPAFDNAAMDGYAVRGTGPWRIVGRVLAGHPMHTPLSDGQAVEIATGAPVPPGTERVLRYEDSHRDADVVYGAVDGPRTHIRRAGEYVAAGQEVLATGEVLRPAALGLAASVGVDTVTVRRRPRVRVLVTGDEVVAAGAPAPGMVRDAIGPTLAALLPAWGAELDIVEYVPDAQAAVTRAVATSLSAVDVTLVGGACSVGPADHLHRVLRDLDAAVHIDGVACRPGHPQVLAQTGARWIVGLPGNPFAALVAATTIVWPLLTGLAGQPLPPLPRAALCGPAPA